jgi:hypothetical protein
MQLRSCLFIVLGLCWAVPKVSGQVQIPKAQLDNYLQVVKKVTNHPILSYRYKLVMENKQNSRSSESISGQLFKNGSDYRDSNTYAMSMIAGNYFFKLDFKKKEAYLYSLPVIEKKLGVKRQDMKASILDISDSLMASMGNLSASEDNGEIMLQYKLKHSAGTVQSISFKIRKSDMNLLEIKLIAKEEGSSISYYLNDFSNQMNDKQFTASQYFSIGNKKAKLSGRYQSYKLNAVL